MSSGQLDKDEITELAENKEASLKSKKKSFFSSSKLFLDPRLLKDYNYLKVHDPFISLLLKKLLNSFFSCSLMFF